MANNLSNLVGVLLKKNKVVFDFKELDFQIQSHPSYPSLHAVTGVLTHFNIDNLALDVPKTEEVIEQLPPCFLAQIQDEKGEDFVVVEKQAENLLLYKANGKEETLSVENFLSKFSGIVVVIENDLVGAEIKKPSIKIESLGAILAVLGIVTLLLLSTPTSSKLTFLLFSLVGVFISYTLVQKDFGITTKIADALCPSSNLKNNCDSVLNSDASNFFGLKLSDIGLVYFVSETLITLTYIYQNINFSPLYILSFITIPFTLYSIYYQYAVVKNWCFLCLAIVATLWLEAGVALYDIGLNFSMAANIRPWLLVLVVFSSMIAIWAFLSSKLKNLNDLKQTKIEYFKFKKNFTLFKTLLEKSETIDTEVDSAEIWFGNREAALELVVVTSPFCGHCKGVHTLVENILKNHNDKTNICIRFNANAENSESDLVKITGRLLEIFHTENEERCLKAMHDIYNGMETGKWIGKWKECADIDQYLPILKNENEWCNAHNINFTPELLLNGRSYPKEYERADLVYFIEELSEIS